MGSISANYDVLSLWLQIKYSPRKYYDLFVTLDREGHKSRSYTPAAEVLRAFHVLFLKEWGIFHPRLQKRIQRIRRRT